MEKNEESRASNLQHNSEGGSKLYKELSKRTEKIVFAVHGDTGIWVITGNLSKMHTLHYYDLYIYITLLNNIQTLIAPKLETASLS